MSNLRQDLQDAHDLLVGVGESFWAGKIQKILAKQSWSERDAKELRSWFGGMGSFNDLMISAVNGHEIDPSDEGPANDRLTKLRGSIFQAATKP